MRIAYLVHQYPPEKEAGTEVHTERLARGMAEAGHEVYVLTVSHDRRRRRFGHQDERRGRVIVRRLFFDPRLAPNPFLWEMHNPTLRPFVAAALAAWRPDVVHVTHAAYLSAAAIRAAADHGAPVVFTLTDFWLLCPTVQLLRHDGTLCRGPEPGVCQRCMTRDGYSAYFGVMPGRAASSASSDRAIEELAEPSDDARYRVVEERPRLLREAFDGVALALSPSRFLKELFVAQGYPESRIEVLPHGVDRIAPEARSRADDGAFHLGYIGSIAPKKGAHVAIQAVEALPSGRRTVLHLHGDDTADPAYAAQLRELAGSDERIVFHGPFPRERAAGVFGSLDAVVMPSLWYENAPLVLREALASGIPAIASGIGGMAETLQEGGGLLVPPGDPQALAVAIARLRDDLDLRARLVAGAPPIPTCEEERHAILAVYQRLVRQREAAIA
ncbi:MAG: glycosyltransferase family 4 protein [Acidobacteriota bacterium]